MSKFARFLPLLLLAACGGQRPAAENPKPAASEPETAAPEAKSEAEPSGTDTDETAKPASKSEAYKSEASKSEASKSEASKSEASKSADKPADDGPKLTRSAKDILTAPDVVFMFSFNDSDVKQSADSKCTASSGNDPKKMNTCLAKARKAVDVDGYRFKEKDGKWWWLTLRTKGKILHTLHKFEIDFGAEKDGSIVIKPKGKDLGSAPGRTPNSVTIQVPNEYQIALTDPKLGKLVYEAKIGIASQ